MKTNTLRRNSDYHGCHIVERLDSKTKPYRQVYRCKSDEIDSVLVRFILDEVPAGLVCAMDGLSLPIEYFFVDCYQSMYPVEVLPNILSCDFDLKEAWYVSMLKDVHSEKKSNSAIKRMRRVRALH